MSANDGEFAVLMPKVGQVMEAGTLLAWIRTDGDSVQRGEVIAEVETDKVTFELESPVAGVLRTRVAEGDEVDVDGLLAVVETAADGRQETATPPPEEAAPATAVTSPQRESVTRTAGGRVPASPKARRLARELGVDLATVQASAADGVISAAEVEAAAASAAPSGAARDSTDTAGSGQRTIRETSSLDGYSTDGGKAVGGVVERHSAQSCR